MICCIIIISTFSVFVFDNKSVQSYKFLMTCRKLFCFFCNFATAMRYFVHLSYDGTRFHGWQIQPNGISVEGEIERCMGIILRHPTDIIGAGRTDAGVHARHMVAHFDLNPEIVSTLPNDVIMVGSQAESGENDKLNCPQLTFRLNRILPPDISIHRIEQVDDSLHARFSAVSRTYHYYLHESKNPFRRTYSYECHFPLDFDAMNNAAAIMMEYEDFACFCKSHTDVKTTFCSITEARWIRASDDSWYFRITANRFLRNMVRAIVGTLIEVGRGKMSIQDFRAVIEGRKRTKAGESMPGNALFLEDVRY